MYEITKLFNKDNSRNETRILPPRSTRPPAAFWQRKQNNPNLLKQTLSTCQRGAATKRRSPQTPQPSRHRPARAELGLPSASPLSRRLCAPLGPAQAAAPADHTEGNHPRFSAMQLKHSRGEKQPLRDTEFTDRGIGEIRTEALL